MSNFVFKDMAKNYHFCFPVLGFSHGQIIVWNLKLPSKTAKLPSASPGPTASALTRVADLILESSPSFRHSAIHQSIKILTHTRTHSLTNPQIRIHTQTHTLTQTLTTFLKPLHIHTYSGSEATFTDYFVCPSVLVYTYLTLCPNFRPNHKLFGALFIYLLSMYI